MPDLHVGSKDPTVWMTKDLKYIYSLGEKSFERFSVESYEWEQLSTNLPAKSQVAFPCWKLPSYLGYKDNQILCFNPSD
jgi:hypothetical protein